MLVQQSYLLLCSVPKTNQQAVVCISECLLLNSTMMLVFFLLCVHPQSKHILIGEVVRVLGVETTLDLFQKASDIQESGGQLTVDGDKK